jgi:endonuclease/exonuclease/phosphatase family metal-dependent hydrolase
MSDSTIRVLTWNLWWRYGPWQQRREAIAATLAEVGPDVCGLQEVWGNAQENLAADLAARLGMHWCWAQVPLPEHWQRRHGEEFAIGNAVLSRWPIAEQNQLWLPTGDTDERRVALHASIDAPAGVLPFFTTHLTYRPGGSALRVAQVHSLAAFVGQHSLTDESSVDSSYPPVVTGDLNAEPDSDELRLLGGLLTEPAVPGQALIDAWRYAASGDPGFTWDLRNGYLAESAIPNSRIDYILAGLPLEGRGRVRSVGLAGTAPVSEVWPSDHFGVVAELQA